MLHQDSQRVINRDEFRRQDSTPEGSVGELGSPNKSSILLVDKDDSDSLSLSSGLRKAGFAVIHTDNGEDAQSLLEISKFQILMLNIRLARTKGTDLIEWARGRFADLRIVALCDFESTAVKRTAIARGANLFVLKPVNVEKLTGLLSDDGQAGAFHGKLLGFDILECLQFILLSGKTMVLRVMSTEGGSGEIFLKEGGVLHAVCGELQGEEALYRCLSFEKGEFSCLPWREPLDRTIFKTGESLLFQAARLRDETRDQSSSWSC